MLNLRLTTDSESEWFQLPRLPDAWHMHKKLILDQLHIQTG